MINFIIRQNKKKNIKNDDSILDKESGKGIYKKMTWREIIKNLEEEILKENIFEI